MKRLVALLILLVSLLAVVLVGCVEEEWDEFPTCPEITEPGSTKEPYPTLITDPDLL